MGDLTPWPGPRALPRPTCCSQEPNPATLRSTKHARRPMHKDDAEAFNSELAKYQKPGWRSTRRTSYDADQGQLRGVLQLRSSRSIWAMVLYVVALRAGGPRLARAGARPLNRAAFWLIVFTLGVHTFALVARIYISGRPPVTNLYSSAVFIGWGCVVLGLVLEWIYRLGIGNVDRRGRRLRHAAHRPLPGRRRRHVRRAAGRARYAVLAGHARGLHHAGLRHDVRRRPAGHDLHPARRAHAQLCRPTCGKDLSRMIYGTLCFAMFFSFVGTVLGGLWADDSWGRFWGWDPKENGALIIVLWNALVLHARWGGMVKRPRPGRAGRRRQHRHQLVVVRRQRAGRRPALLRLHRRRAAGPGPVRRHPTGRDRPGRAAEAHVVELPLTASRIHRDWRRLGQPSADLQRRR